MNIEEKNIDEEEDSQGSSSQGNQSPIDNEKESIFYILGLFSSIENNEEINNEVFENTNQSLKEKFLKGYNRKDFLDEKQKISLEKDKVINKNNKIK